MRNGSLTPKLMHGDEGAVIKHVAQLTPLISIVRDLASASVIRLMYPFCIFESQIKSGWLRRKIKISLHTLISTLSNLPSDAVKNWQKSFLKRVAEHFLVLTQNRVTCSNQFCSLMVKIVYGCRNLMIFFFNFKQIIHQKVFSSQHEWKW